MLVYVFGLDSVFELDLGLCLGLCYGLSLSLYLVFHLSFVLWVFLNLNIINLKSGM